MKLRRNTLKEDTSNTKNAANQKNPIADDENANETEKSMITFDKKEKKTNSGATNRKLRIKKKLSYNV